jgi:hypothetical protein
MMSLFRRTTLDSLVAQCSGISETFGEYYLFIINILYQDAQAAVPDDSSGNRKKKWKTSRASFL